MSGAAASPGTTAAEDPTGYDPTSDEVLADPFPAYVGLRDQCPVHLHHGLEHPMYTLSRHDDVREMLSDAELWSNRYGPGISYSDQNSGSLQRYDPPEHTRRRRLARDPFLPRAVEANAPTITAIAAEILDDIGPRGAADLHDDFASPLPIATFTALVGTPDADRSLLKRWAEILTLGMTYPDQATDSWIELRTYTLGEIRRRRDGDAPPGLLTDLVTTAFDDGSYATDDEICGMVSMMLVAGHETTASLICNLVWRLLEDRSRWERLVAEPELVPNAIEESLRFDPPVLGICRTNTRPVELHGVEIPVDSKVLYAMGAANRDPEVFDRPEEFVIDRPLIDARRHVAFGWGAHFCLGAHLARLTARVATEQLIDRLPGLTLAGDTTRLDAPFLWGRRHLPVRW